MIHDSVTLSKKEYLRPFIFWRHGRVVRRGTANPFSPVQIRVSPDQHNKWLGILLRRSDITGLILARRTKRTVDTLFYLSSESASKYTGSMKEGL